MDSNSNTSKRVYEDFEPAFNWVHGEESDVLILMLSGFRRQELKVQITSTRILRECGEEKMDENRLRRRRFYKEFFIPTDSDAKAIGAKFEGGKLYVKLPKVIAPSKPPTTHVKAAQQEVIPPKTRDHKAKAQAQAAKTDEVISQKKQEKENNLCLSSARCYKEAIFGLLVRLKKQKKLVNLLVVGILMVLVIGICVRNNAMQSSPGVSSNQDL